MPDAPTPENDKDLILDCRNYLKAAHVALELLAALIGPVLMEDEEETLRDAREDLERAAILFDHIASDDGERTLQESPKKGGFRANSLKVEHPKEQNKNRRKSRF